MPTYDYLCSKCGHEFEVQQKMSDSPINICEKCGGEVTKLISSGNFLLKGGGWYADGYSSNKGSKDRSCESKSASCGSCESA
ncbi:MAG: FmdB family zinc ribbon protein [Deltaproteobacteria bacterium]